MPRARRGRLFAVHVLRGQAQVHFMPSALTGVIFTVALFIAGWQYGLYGLIGTAIGTGTAQLLGVGPAAGCPPGSKGSTPASSRSASPCSSAPPIRPRWCLAAGGCAIITVVTAAAATLLRGWGLPTLTLPFCLMASAMTIAAPGFERVWHGGPATAGLSRAAEGTVALAVDDVAARLLREHRADLPHAAVVRRTDLPRRHLRGQPDRGGDGLRRQRRRPGDRLGARRSHRPDRGRHHGLQRGARRDGAVRGAARGRPLEPRLRGGRRGCGHRARARPERARSRRPAGTPSRGRSFSPRWSSSPPYRRCRGFTAPEPTGRPAAGRSRSRVPTSSSAPVSGLSAGAFAHPHGLHGMRATCGGVRVRV